GRIAMDVRYTDSARNSEAYPLLQQLTGLLPEVVGAPAERVKVAWDRKTDPRGGSRYSLRLAGSGEEAQADFRVDELQNPLVMHFRLHHLWGDVLQERSHKQLRKMLNSNGAPGM